MPPRIAVMPRAGDISALLDELIASLAAGGFATEVELLRGAMRTTSSSSLEILGEVGLALLRVQADVGHLLPRRARRQLGRCLREVRMTWPELELP